jgi:hypothetical protein
LHYQPRFWGSDQSEADGPQFFLSPDGAQDPLAELKADLAAFQSKRLITNGDIHQTAQCAFPERYRFLKETLKLSIVEQSCPELVEWKSRFHAKSVTLIYAGAFLGSPSSMFGHTFLRIDSEARPGVAVKNDLLDYGVSFDATMGPHPGLAYPVKGLLGYFPGQFSQLPFFIKINSYVNMESRDLWEYQLNLAPDQLDHLLNHLWELTSSSFDYYFLNKNCSYQLMALLEVSNPDWNLTEKFGAKTIPVDTIRALSTDPHAIQRVTFRPSLLRAIDYKIGLLSENQKRLFYLAEKNPEVVNEKYPGAVLDILMDWQKYNSMQESLTNDEADKKINLQWLAWRAAQSDASVEFPSRDESQWPIRPDQGHRSGKISAHWGSEANINYLGLEIRPAFHDLLDSDDGFLPNSALNIGRMRASVLTDGSGTLRLDELLAGEVISLKPWTGLQKPLSWQVQGGLQRPVDLCGSCAVAQVQGGVGLTWGSTEISSALLATGHVESNGRAGPGVLWIGLWKITDRVKAKVNYEHIRYFPAPDIHFQTKSEATVSWSTGQGEVRVAAAGVQTGQTFFNILDLGMSYYF